MRVLALLNHLEIGGVSINALDFAVAAVPAGVETTFLGWRHTLPTVGPTMLDVATDRGLRVEVLDRPPGTLATARLLSRAAQRVNADIIHANTVWEARPAFLGPAGLGRRPLVVTVYEMAVPAEMLPSAALVVGTRALAAEHAGRRGPLQMISPPVDLARDDPRAVDGDTWRKELDLDPGQVLLVTVSRLAELMKARPIEVAIDAMSRLGPQTVLAVVGDGDAAARLRRLADEANSHLGRPAVRMLGAMADPRPAYAGADIVLGMGGSAARGLAFGKPLVALGERGWSRRFDRDSAEAVFADSFWSDSEPVDAVGDIVAAVSPLTASADLREDLGAFGHAFAVRSFGLDAMTAQLVGLYREVLGRPWRAAWVRDLAHWSRVPAHGFARRVAGLVPESTQGRG